MALVRDYKAADAPRLRKVYQAAVADIGSRDYSAEQIRVWAALAPTAERFGELMTDGRIRLVAVDRGDLPVAFADLERDGHIHFLYADPSAAGKGIVSALYDVLEQRARQLGIARLHSEASEAALRFFLKKGFTKTARRDFEVEGVAIHNYAVEKRL